MSRHDFEVGQVVRAVKKGYSWAEGDIGLVVDATIDSIDIDFSRVKDQEYEADGVWTADPEFFEAVPEDKVAPWSLLRAGDTVVALEGLEYGLGGWYYQAGDFGAIVECRPHICEVDFHDVRNSRVYEKGNWWAAKQLLRYSAPPKKPRGIRVGDQVVSLRDSEDGVFFAGDHGTVVNIDNDADGTPFFVDFNDERNARVVDDGCWWMSPGEFAPDSTPPQPRIIDGITAGDIVEATDDCTTYRAGDLGEVLSRTGPLLTVQWHEGERDFVPACHVQKHEPEVVEATCEVNLAEAMAPSSQTARFRITSFTVECDGQAVEVANDDVDYDSEWVIRTEEFRIGGREDLDALNDVIHRTSDALQAAGVL